MTEHTVLYRPLTLLSPRNKQQGVVLIIALIVLVAMTLAGIGMMRSVDTANMIAGNLAFRQSTLQASDNGINAAFAWLQANSGGTTLNNDNNPSGYFSAKPATEPNWSDPVNWQNGVNAVALPQDPLTQNTVSYVIHRMCSCASTPYNGTCPGGAANQCALYLPTGGTGTGGSMAVGSFVFQGTPQVYYRITARTVGPRNTVSTVQAMVQF